MRSRPKTLYTAGGYDIENFEKRKQMARVSVNEIMKLVDRQKANNKVTVISLR